MLFISKFSILSLFVFFCLFFWDFLSFQLFQKYSALPWIMLKVPTSKSLSGNSNICVISELTSIDFFPLAKCQDFLIHHMLRCYGHYICAFWILCYESQRAIDSVDLYVLSGNFPCYVQHPSSYTPRADFNAKSVFRAFAVLFSSSPVHHSVACLRPKRWLVL